MLLRHCIRAEIYTFIQRKSALQMSILVVFYLFASILCTQTTILYALSIWQQLTGTSTSTRTYIQYVNGEHVLKHILLKYTQRAIGREWRAFDMVDPYAIPREHVKQSVRNMFANSNILYNQPNGSDSLAESIRWVSITCLVVCHLLGFSLELRIVLSFCVFTSVLSIQYWAKFTNSHVC